MKALNSKLSGRSVLTVEEIEELRGVVGGADIWGYDNAGRLRSIQRKAPDLITICQAANRPPGHMRQPYFGAITTSQGRRFLAGLNPVSQLDEEVAS